MRIVIAGGSGFLGRPLAEACRADGHTVTLLTRATTSTPDAVHWVPNGQAGPWAAALHQTDAVINLAGASIAGGRWTARRKALLRESRLLATRSLIEAIAQQPQPPAVFISGSAVGYYGPRGDDPVTEDTPKGCDFLAELAADWEDAARPVARLAYVWCCSGRAFPLRPMAASSGACCCPSVLAREDGSALAANTCRGFTGVTGSISSGGRSRHDPWKAPSISARPSPSQTRRSGQRSRACSIGRSSRTCRRSRCGSDSESWREHC